MLHEFCRSVVLKYGLSASLMDGALAREFAEYFSLSSRPTLGEFRLLCEELGVDMGAKRLPAEMSAHHYLDRTAGKYRLEYEREQWVGTSEFNVAHDLYEIIQETIEDANPGYTAPRNPALPTCMAPYANKFAAELLMNEDLFQSAVIETGFDVVELHNRFCKAYSAVAIRTVETLRDVPGNAIQVLIAIYDRHEEEKELCLWDNCSRDKFRAACVAKTQGLRIYRKGRPIKFPSYPSGLLPRKEDGVLPGGLVDHVIEGSGPLYIERVWGFDLWDSNDLVALAVPVRWRRSRDKTFTVLAKVILIVMPGEQAIMLEPQLRKLKPMVIPERFQFI